MAEIKIDEKIFAGLEGKVVIITGANWPQFLCPSFPFLFLPVLVD
jgi:hypothetical protein